MAAVEASEISGLEETAPVTGPGISLRLKLAAVVAGLVILTGGLGLAAVWWASRGMIQQEVAGRLMALASDRARSVRELLRQKSQAVRALAARPAVVALLEQRARGATAEGFGAEAERWLNAALREAGELQSLSLVDRGGLVLATTGTAAAGSRIDLAEVERTGVGLSAGPALALPAVTARVPTGSAVLVATIEPAALRRRFGSARALEETLFAVRSGDHFQLLSSDGRTEAAVVEREARASAAAIAGRTGLMADDDRDGHPVLAAFHPVRTGSFGLVVQIDRADAQEPLTRLGRRLLAIECGVLVLGGLASYLLARRLTRPLAALADSAALVAAGNLGVHVPVPSSDELGTLARSFNRMTAKLAASYAGLEQKVLERTEASQRSEGALRDQTRLLQSMLDALADGVVATGPGGEFLIYNPAATRIIGLGASETAPGAWPEHYGLFHPDGTARYREEELPLVRAMRGESVDALEVLVRNPIHPEGVLISINARPLPDEQGRPHGGIVVFRDITAQRAGEEELKRTAAELAETNLRLQRFAQDLVRAVSAEQKSRLELEHAHDELKRAETQLVQSEKLSALGLIVAGVAHEINNPLAYVSNNLVVLQRDLGCLNRLIEAFREAEPVLSKHDPALLDRLQRFAESIDLPYTQQSLHTIIDRSRDGLRRIDQIVRDLRDFARVDAGDFHASDLNEGLRSTANIIRGRAKTLDIELKLELTPLPQVICQSGKIHQVVLNLLVNALDACSKGACVTLRSRPEADGQRVVLEIEDTGTGIPDEIQARIFDPFFTTKPVGQGTGLGLSISYGIVQAHGGSLRVDSTPGRGSRFTVILPVKPPQPAGPQDPH